LAITHQHADPKPNGVDLWPARHTGSPQVRAGVPEFTP
jgi:hypothetical protein